jgi:hypothetical protein
LQYVLYYDDEHYGGFEGTLGSLKNADPEFGSLTLDIYFQ